MPFYHAETLLAGSSILPKAPREERFFEVPKPVRVAKKWEPAKKTSGVAFELKQIATKVSKTLHKDTITFLAQDSWAKEFEGIRFPAFRATGQTIGETYRRRLASAARAVGATPAELLPIQNDSIALRKKIDEREAVEQDGHETDWKALTSLVNRVGEDIIKANTAVRLGTAVNGLDGGKNVMARASRIYRVFRARHLTLTSLMNRQNIYPEDIDSMQRLAKGLQVSAGQLKRMVSLNEREGIAEAVKGKFNVPKKDTRAELSGISTDLKTAVAPLSEVSRIINRCKTRANRMTKKDKNVAKADDIVALTREVSSLLKRQVAKLRGETPGDAYLQISYSSPLQKARVRKAGKEYMEMLEKYAEQLDNAFVDPKPLIAQKKAA